TSPVFNVCSGGAWRMSGHQRAWSCSKVAGSNTAGSVTFCTLFTAWISFQPVCPASYTQRPMIATPSPRPSLPAPSQSRLGVGPDHRLVQVVVVLEVRERAVVFLVRPVRGDTLLLVRVRHVGPFANQVALPAGMGHDVVAHLQVILVAGRIVRPARKLLEVV